MSGNAIRVRGGAVCKGLLYDFTVYRCGLCPFVSGSRKEMREHVRERHHIRGRHKPSDTSSTYEGVER
jgi:hypothetical protein